MQIRVPLAAQALPHPNGLRFGEMQNLWPVAAMNREPLQAMLDEAGRHGANERDLDLLREQFRQQAESNKPADDDTRSQIGEIPI
jgi:hypothetical protein